MKPLQWRYRCSHIAILIQKSPEVQRDQTHAQEHTASKICSLNPHLMTPNQVFPNHSHHALPWETLGWASGKCVKLSLAHWDDWVVFHSWQDKLPLKYHLLLLFFKEHHAGYKPHILGKQVSHHSWRTVVSLNVRWREVTHQSHRTAFCLMCDNLFVLRSNGLITRALLKRKRQMERWQKARLGQNSKKIPCRMDLM